MHTLAFFHLMIVCNILVISFRQIKCTMETDLVCPQRSESQDKCINVDKDSQLTENFENQEETEKQDIEATSKIERVESPPQPDGAHTFLPADGAVEPNTEELNNEAQEWPPVPELENDTQTERDECHGINTDTEPSDDGLTHAQDADGVEQEDCSAEHPLDSHDDSDSVVFLSENSDAQNVQQEALEPNEQQVCDDAPPLDTVTGEPANPERDSPACNSTEDKEPLTMTEATRDAEGEEGRERGETGEERKQTGGAEEERQAEVKDQKDVENKAPGEAETHMPKAEGKEGKMDVDDSQSDSGVSTDFSPNGTTDASDCPANPDAPAFSESPPNETPIEREIRLAMMREQNLRRDRGLDDTPDRTKEFVEIPVRKPILSQDPKASPSQGKDRNFAGKKMQMEISAEAEREKVLVELGRLPGFYDKGTEVQVQEKKLLFESLQDSNARSSSTNGEQAAVQDLEYSVDIKQRLMQFSQNLPEPEGSKSDPPVGPGLTEAVPAQVIIIETTPIFTPVPDSNRAHGTTSRTDGGSTTDKKASSSEPVGTTQRQGLEDKDDADLSLVKENPFFKLRSPAMLPQVEQDIKEAKERERELQMQRNSLYGGAAVEPEAETKRVETERQTEIDSGMGERDKTESRVEEETTSPSDKILSPSANQTNLNLTACQSEASTTPTSGESLETSHV